MELETRRKSRRRSLNGGPYPAVTQLLPSCKQHTPPDDRAGVIVDTEVVTGEKSGFANMANRLDALEIKLGRRPAP